MQILFREDQLVAVNKPSGLLVHRSWIAADATDFALQRVRALVNLVLVVEVTSPSTAQNDRGAKLLQ